jgi:hypothetical protein
MDIQEALFDLPSNSSRPPVVIEERPGAQDLYERVSSDAGSLSLSEALATMDLVDVGSNGQFLIMAERDSDAPTYDDGTVKFRDPGILKNAAISEMGYTSPSPFTSWTRRDDNTKLQGQSGLRIYYNMRRQDGAVRATQRLVKTPVQGAHWFVEPFVKDDNSPVTTQDQNIANFIERDLFTDMNVSWSTFLADTLLCLDYGYMAFEKVWAFGPDNKLHLRKLGPRHPLDIQEWLYDREGGPDGCIMFSNPYSGPSAISEGTGMASPGDPSMPFIPINKLVIFTHEAEAGDLTGIPVLRSVYKHWYYKDTLYKIDAIQKERHGIGVPIIKLPPGFSAADQALADNLGRNLRTNERAHVTLPPMWDLIFAKLEGQPVDCLKSIEHHDMRIKSNILGSFLDATTGTQDGNIDMFLKSTRYIAEMIADIFNKYVIPQMVDMNFKLGPDRGYPMLRARRIGEWEDLRTLSFAIRNMVGADVIRPDDRLEAHLRREMDLPAADPTTTRVPANPALSVEKAARPATDAPTDPGAEAAAKHEPGTNPPGTSGSATTANGQQVQDAANNKSGGARQRNLPPVGTPRSNSGTDRSGGK